jgi:hypothetical protein
VTKTRDVKQGITSASRCAVWLIVARTGWCDLDEIRGEPDSPEESSLKRVLHELKKHGYIVGRKISWELRHKAMKAGGNACSWEYAVTEGCKIPFGLLAGEVANALSVHRREPVNSERIS